MVTGSEPKLNNTKLGLRLARFFALLTGSMFTLYSYSWFVTQHLLLAGFIAVPALLMLVVAVLPNRTLDELIQRMPLP
jgi:hypothetical protein